MAISVVSISSDSSKEIVWTSTARVILFGTIPTAILANVPIVDLLVVHDDTSLIPTETPTIPLVVSTLPHTSPFMYTDSSDSDTSERPPSQDSFSSDTSSGSSLGYSLDTSLGRSIPYSSFDSPPDSFTGPSRKRRRSPAVSVSLATPVPRALSPIRANLLPHRKRIRGSVSSTAHDDSAEESNKAYIEPCIDSDVQANIDADTAAVEATAAGEEDARVKVDTRIDREDEVKEEAESSHRGTVKIEVDIVIEPVVSEDTHVPTDDDGSREVGHRMLVASQKSVVMSDRIGVLERDNMRLRAIFLTKSRYPQRGRENGDGYGNDNGNDNENGNGYGGGNGNRNGPGGGNGNGNPNVNVGGVVPAALECTYQDFLKCQPLIFKGNEGVVGLTRWFEKMETNGALTWWNSHKRTVGTDASYAMTWKELIKLMTEVYCPRNEIQKMETELWNLTMVLEEEDHVEKFIGGLPDNIQGNMIAGEPTRLQDAIRIANNLMEPKVKGYAARNEENKRIFENNSRDNRVQQPPFKRQNGNGQNVARAYTVGNSEKRGYAGPLPYYNKCKLYHKGHCTVKCSNCKRVGHMTRDCRVAVATTIQGDLEPNQKVITCNECGRQGHYRSDYPKMKNQNRADMSFVSTTFSVSLDIVPSTLDIRSFDVIIGMDWLSRYHAVIICDEKVVRIPYGNKVLEIQEDGCSGGDKSRLSTISCTKTQKYIHKGCQVFLAQVMEKKAEDKSKEKRIEDVSTVQDFLEVFLEDFPGLPLTRQVEFQIDLVPDLHPWHDPCTGGIHGSDESGDHEEHNKLILELLKKEELYAKFSKCEFWLPKVQFIGHMIDSEGIHLDPAKIESIKDWASPKTPTEIHQFLGLASYYR
ncbi:putative reverse transcriptase domain-containing protein [Tanacetum coccineum]